MEILVEVLLLRWEEKINVSNCNLIMSETRSDTYEADKAGALSVWLSCMDNQKL